MSYDKQSVTKDEIKKWKKDKSINPRTNRKIRIDSKIYKYLQKMEKEIIKKKKDIINVKTVDTSINTELKFDDTNSELNKLKEKSLKNDETILNLKNELDEECLKNKEIIISLKNSINDLKNINHKISKELKEKEKLLEENKSEISKLKESVTKIDLIDKQTQTEIEIFNNFKILIPLGLICFGLVTKYMIY